MLRKVTRSSLWLLVPIGLLLGSPAWGEIRQADNAELERLLRDGVPLIDVRTPKEWMDTGVIRNSHLLTFFDEQGRYDLEIWTAQLDKIADKSKPFILICDVGVRTDAISRVLHNQLHYQKVYNVTQGIQSWITLGNETVRPPMVIRINP